MPVRMKDVARDLNVSVVTVSKALRDRSDISPATKKRILKRLRELNYRPNWIARRVDGLILASAQSPSRNELFHAIEDHKVPYVLIDRKIGGLKANYVGVDDKEVGRMATGHLIACGCRSIAHIRGPSIGTAMGRLAGYRKALAEHGLEVPAGF